MTNIISYSNKSCLFGNTGNKLNIIQINLDQTDASANSTCQTRGDNTKPKTFPPMSSAGQGQHIIKIDYENLDCCSSDDNINNYSSNKHLNKKTKRSNKKEKHQSIKNNKDNNRFKNVKCKTIFKIFNDFKSSSASFKDFPQFIYIEKNVKNNLYSSINDLATEIRGIFSQIFYSCQDPKKYERTLLLCQVFEDLYSSYDNKIFLREAKSLTEIINKLKKELRTSETFKNNCNYNSNSYFNFNNLNNSSNSLYCYSNKNNNKFKLNLDKNFVDEELNNNQNESSLKNYKNEIGDKIRKLSKEQKKGILNIISQNCLDTNSDPKVMKLDINKMPFNQLKQLENYLNKCIQENNSSYNNNIDNNSYELSGKALNNIELSRSKSFEEEKKTDMMGNDDESSSLSDDEDNE